MKKMDKKKEEGKNLPPFMRKLTIITNCDQHPIQERSCQTIHVRYEV
jgi:hypothetical protein